MKNYLLLLSLFGTPLLLKAQTDTVSSKISKLAYKHVDAIAKFPQGDFKNYITHGLQINHTVEYSIKGQIVLLVGIGADGSIAHVSVLKSLSPEIDPEVIHVIASSPKWQPAMLNGQKVSMDMVLNIDLAVKGLKPLPVKPVIVKHPPVNKPVLITKVAPPVINKTVIAPVKKQPVVMASKPAPIVIKKAMPPPVVKKLAPVVAKKVVPPIVKKPAPVIAKKVEPPVVKKSASVVAKKVEPPVVKKPAPVIAKKVEPPVIKKPTPAIAKKVEPPVIKKPAPAIAKKVEPPVVKKPAPVIAKKVEPPVIKKPAPVIAKKVEPPVIKKPAPVIAKKVELPVVKKPAPVIAKKVEPPVIKKSAPVIAKKPVPLVVKKPTPVIAKKPATPAIKEPVVAKQGETTPVKRPRRIVAKADMFHPNSNDPVFPGGGFAAFFRYLGENIAYPIGSKTSNIEGVVKLSFTVEDDGTVDEVEVESSPAEDLSQEAIRVLLASPKWKPGYQNGRNVPVSYTIPIKFSLKNNN